jgi:AmiR/NasT family two-component response regulator
LEEALASRIVIEQAKGAVSARCEVPVDVAFEMIRGMARSRRRGLQEFCAEIVTNGGRFMVDQRAARQPGGSDSDGSGKAGR